MVFTYVNYIFIFKLRIQSTLTGVAQAVVDHIARIYNDTYEAQDTATGAVRPNIMLIVRNFNFAMPNSITEENHIWNNSYDEQGCYFYIHYGNCIIWLHNFF